MKRIRDANETRSQYVSRIQKDKYENDEEYKYNVKLIYYRNKYKDDDEIKDILSNDTISNKEKFYNIKITCMMNSK